MKRYDLNNDEAFPCNCNMLECQTGEFVRYKDVKPMTKEEAEKLVQDLIAPMKGWLNLKTKLDLEPFVAIGKAHKALIAALTGKEEV